MSSNEQSKRTYSQISHKVRLELIDLVEKQNYPLSVAGQLLGIKLSTAKLIMSKFKSKGYITKYKREKVEQEHIRKRKQIKNQEKIGSQPEEKTKKTPTNNQLQPEKTENSPIQPFIGLYTNMFGYLPYYNFQIPVYYGWNFPQ